MEINWVKFNKSRRYKIMTLFSYSARTYIYSWALLEGNSTFLQ